MFGIFDALCIKNLQRSLKRCLSTPQECVIFPHKNPDGDALGSYTCPLAFFTKKKATIVMLFLQMNTLNFSNGCPGKNRFTVLAKTAEACEKLITEATVFFTLDFNALGRIGSNG